MRRASEGRRSRRLCRGRPLRAPVVLPSVCTLTHTRVNMLLYVLGEVEVNTRRPHSCEAAVQTCCSQMSRKSERT
eukprot:2465013-Pleurochrysis_carterae.AAC.4